MGPYYELEQSTKAVVVGSNEIFTAGLTVTLGEQGWTVEGPFRFIEEVDLASAPDVVILDLPKDAGGVNVILDGCRRLTRAPASLRVLAITDVTQPDLFDRAMRAGLSGLLSRYIPPADLDKAARAVTQGKTAFDRSFAVRSLRDHVLPEMRSAMSDRDLALVRHLAEGCSTEDIARRLGRSPSTVKLRVGDLKRRFGAENRAGLVYMAIKQGLI